MTDLHAALHLLFDLLAVALMLIALVYRRRWLMLSRDVPVDLQCLSQALRAHLRRGVAPAQLEIQSPAVKRIWHSFLALESRARAAENDHTTLEELVTAGTSIRAAASDGISTAEKTAEAILQRCRPEAAAVLVAMGEDGDCRKLTAIAGMRNKRLHDAVLLAAEAIEFRGGGVREHFYRPALSGSPFDFSAFGISASFYVPMTEKGNRRGLIWIGMRSRNAVLVPKQIRLIEALAAHAMASFRIAEGVQNLVERFEAERKFFQGVSHDLRAPGNAALYALRDMRDEPLAERQRERLGIIEEAIEEQSSLLGTFLDFTQHQRGCLRAAPGDFDAVSAIESLLRPFEYVAKRKGVTLTFGARCRVAVRCDPAHFRRIVANLISNAVKYTDRGSIEVRLECDEMRSTVSVFDTGLGVPEEERAFLFTEDRRSRTARRRPGLGLGLALCRTMAEMNGGSVEYAPQDSGGSVFSLVLPVAPIPVPQGELRQTETPRVLIVDDDPASARRHRRILEKSGGEIAIAGSLREARDLSGQWCPRLVVADRYLNDGSLEDLLQSYAASGQHPALVVVSGQIGGSNSVLNAFRPEWVEKPADPATLLSAARSALAKAMAQ